MRSNKYAAKCADCGTEVPASAGNLTNEAGTWVVRCTQCPTVQPATAVETKVLPRTSAFAPTEEQQAALDLFALGDSMVIEAGAGTGKTSTLKLLAESAPRRRGQYVAFNKAIVVEAQAKFPKNVACNTAHSLAFKAVGKRYSHRLNSNRMRGDQLAYMLRLQPITILVEGEPRTLAPSFLAGHVMRSVEAFCQSADEAPARRHVPYIDGIDQPTEDGRRTFANNDELAGRLLPFVVRAWADLLDPTGQLPYKHDHYLKAWQLSNPVIPADFILFDEAQDANPVMAAVIAAQTETQVVYVGDSQQAIYEFTGAVNTLAKLDTDHRVFLTQSFRFGPKLADVANVILERLDAELRLVGTPTIATEIGLLEHEDAILCRTNARAVATVMELQELGRKPHLVGGGAEVVSFAKAARDLQLAGSTSHPELACFASWAAVEDYVANDAQGSDLRLLVKLVTEFGVDAILAALESMPSEKAADVIISTAHKAKGREWDKVRLADDFPVKEDEELSTSEMRLLYVAVTRARLQLDMSAVASFFADYGDSAELPDIVDDRLDWVDGLQG